MWKAKRNYFRLANKQGSKRGNRMEGKVGKCFRLRLSEQKPKKKRQEQKADAKIIFGKVSRLKSF